MAATTKRPGAAALQMDILELSTRIDRTGDGRLRACVARPASPR